MGLFDSSIPDEGPPTYERNGDQWISDNDEGKVKDNLPPKWRVMSLVSPRYTFCQYLSPEMGHDGGLCDCMTKVGPRV